MSVAIKELMKYSPVFLYGKAGSGKTHLLQVIAREFKNVYKKPCLYATAEDFTKELIFSIRKGQKNLFEQKYRNNGLLIIDDIQFLAGKFMTQEELLLILKEFQIKDSQIILTANRHPKCIFGLHNELIDSCYGGLMLDIEMLHKTLNFQQFFLNPSPI